LRFTKLELDIRLQRHKRRYVRGVLGEGKGQLLPSPLNSGLSEKCQKNLFFAQKFRLKVLNLRTKNPILRKFIDDIEILSTIELTD